jgi:hypothetical protein
MTFAWKNTPKFAIRHVRLVRLFSLVGLACTAPSLAFAEPPMVPAASSQDAAARAKAEKDVRTFASAYATAESEASLFGLANAEFDLGDWGLAYEHFETYLTRYGPKAPAAKRMAAEKRFNGVSAKTGLLSVTVSAQGAEIRAAGKLVGTTPPKTLRLPAGTIKIAIAKDGFVPWEGEANVVSGGLASLSVALVEAKPAVPVPVLSAPIAVAASEPASVKVAVSENQGRIFIDDKSVGEGSASLLLPAGEHRLKVTRDGYEPYEKTFTLKSQEAFAEAVTLRIVATVVTEVVEARPRPLEGVYGGVNLGGVIQPGGLGGTLDTRCQERDGLGANSCDNGSASGAALGAFVGYQWDPVGIELYLEGQYDHTKHSVGFDGVGDSAANRLAVGIARTEVFDIHRAGGAGLLRARIVLQSKIVRFALAGGVGMAVRRMFLTREATSADTQLTEKFAPASVGYVSPVLNLDASIGLRTSEAFVVKLGIRTSIENATVVSSDSARTKVDTSRALTGGGRIEALATPSYLLAGGGQAFVGLYAGIEFGP